MSLLEETERSSLILNKRMGCHGVQITQGWLISYTVNVVNMQLKKPNSVPALLFPANLHSLYQRVAEWPLVSIP